MKTRNTDHLRQPTLCSGLGRNAVLTTVLQGLWKEQISDYHECIMCLLHSISKSFAATCASRCYGHCVDNRCRTKAVEAGGRWARAQNGSQGRGRSPGESGGSCEGGAGQGSEEAGLRWEGHVGTDEALSELGGGITTFSYAVRIA